MSWHLVNNMLRNFQQIDKPKDNPVNHTKVRTKRDNVLERKIHGLITKFEHLRDDDCELINVIWLEEITARYGDPQRLTIDFFFSIHQHLTKADSICRYRRRIQQTNPELRGKHYKKRQSKIADWKEDLGYKNEPTP